jgi:serine/threonine protein kinase
LSDGPRIRKLRLQIGGEVRVKSERLKGARLGGYEIVRLIGHGATGSVFEATHLGLGKPVAVKVLHEHLAADKQAVGRFLREGRVAARLDHPNAVDVLDVGVEAATPFLVMELLAGGDLRALLSDIHLLTLEHALAVVLPICSALAVAHDAGILHRDLKPANIFLARDVRGDIVPKLVDFGLSKIADGDNTSPLTESELVAGTALYMAPEQTLGMRNSSPASDQYSLGAILYECVTGEPPFSSDGVYALLERIRTEPIRPPSQRNPRLPESVDAVLFRAMHRDPSKRFPSVRAFARALIPFANPKAIAPYERDFLERASVAPRTVSRPSLRKVAAATQAETLSERPAPPPPLSAPPAQKVPPLPCAPGTSPFHIKGMAYRGFVYLVGKMVPGGLEAFCEALSDEALAGFVRQPFLASGRYDILPLYPLNAILARLLGVEFEALIRKTAAGQARYDAETVFKTMWSNATVENFADRISRFGTQYYDFGKYTGSVPEPHVIVASHEKVPEYVYPWYGPMQITYTEQCMRMLGAVDLKVRAHVWDPAGIQDGFPLINVRTELRWRSPS